MKTRTRPTALLLLWTTGCPPVVEGVGPGVDTSSTLTTEDTGDDPSGSTSPPTSTTTLTPTTGATPTSGDTPDTTSGSPGDATSTGDAPAAVCGNGIVEEPEACDDGFDGNQQGNSCTEACEAAACGDGHVQVDNAEACDHGALNVENPGYNQCSTGCLRGGHCGDGLVQAGGGEECELSARPDGAANCAMCRLKPRVVFLTSASYPGGALGGVAGADKICNQFVAASPALTGTFRAWLLVDGQVLADRFPEFAEPAVSWNFSNMASDLLATNFKQLVELGPASPIVYTEGGEPLPKQLVWTNINAVGVAAGGDCGQWTSTEAAPALVGHTGFLPDQGEMSEQWHADRWWTDRASLKKFCHEPYHLYCVQVAD